MMTAGHEAGMTLLLQLNQTINALCVEVSQTATIEIEATQTHLRSLRNW